MKTRDSVLLLAASALLLAACGDGSRNGVEGAATPAPAATSAAVEASAQPVGATATRFEMPAGIATGGACALDAINGQPAAATAAITGPVVVFGGWAVPADAGSTEQAHLVLSSGADSYAVPLARDVQRQDVAEAMGNAGAALSGFNVAVATGGLPAGTYSVQAVFTAGATTCILHDAIPVNP